MTGFGNSRRIARRAPSPASCRDQTGRCHAQQAQHRHRKPLAGDGPGRESDAPAGRSAACFALEFEVRIAAIGRGRYLRSRDSTKPCFPVPRHDVPACRRGCRDRRGRKQPTPTFTMPFDVAHHLAVFKRGADELLVESEFAAKLARGQPLRSGKASTRRGPTCTSATRCSSTSCASCRTSATTSRS